MSHLDKLRMKPHGLCVWTHKVSRSYKESEPKMLCDERKDPRRLSKSVKHNKRPSALAYDEKNIHVKW